MEAEYPTLNSRSLTLVFRIPINRIKKFWEKLEKGEVYTTKCKKCGKILFPPAADCPECFASEVEWVELENEAKIVAFTHVIVKPASFQQEKPYTVVIAQLKDGIKVLSWLKEAKISKIRVGMEVKLIVKPHPKGGFAYMFVPK